MIQTLGSEEFLVATTGKCSREIYEIRERLGMSHANDFLTVGSMGHASSLALGISLFSEKNIYCIDGDGALLMHMGGLATAVQYGKENLKYILMNNGCHESVGKQPTIAYRLDLKKILEGFGFKKVLTVNTVKELTEGIREMQAQGKTALIININEKSGKDLGRPASTPKENKIMFQEKLRRPVRK